MRAGLILWCLGAFLHVPDWNQGGCKCKRFFFPFFFLYLGVNYTCVPGEGCGESVSCFQWLYSPLRRPEFQADTIIKLMNACQALIQYALTLLSPLPSAGGKEAGVFNKVIAPLLYFPFINYKN